MFVLPVTQTRAHSVVSANGVITLLRTLLITIASMLVLPSPLLFATEKPLTLTDAQQVALTRSRQLFSQDQAIAASRDMAVAAGQLPDPVLSAGIDNLPVSGTSQWNLTSDFMTMRRIGLMQEITGADKRRLRSERVDRAADKLLAEKAGIAARLERDTAIAWLDRYYAEEMSRLVTEQTAQARLEIQATQGAYRAGRASQSDIIAAQSALTMEEDRASDITRRLRNAHTMLLRWVGNAAAQAPLAGIPGIDSLRFDTNALDTLLLQHPQMLALGEQIAIAETEAKLAQANKNADWSIGVTLQQRGPAYSNMISVGISIPFQWDQPHRQDREISSKLAIAGQARAERDDALQTFIAQIRSVLNEWESNRERIIRFNHELIPLAKERTQAVMSSYRGGKASQIELLAARRNEIETQLQSLQLQADTARLWAQLNFLFPLSKEELSTHTIINRDQP